MKRNHMLCYAGIYPVFFFITQPRVFGTPPFALADRTDQHSTDSGERYYIQQSSDLLLGFQNNLNVSHHTYMNTYLTYLLNRYMYVRTLREYCYRLNYNYN